MLQLHTDLAAAVVAHALADHPVEACGLLAGPPQGPPVRVVSLRNAAASSECFRFDSREQLHAWREMDERGEVPLVFYHSHTASPAYPSQDDVRFASDPHAHYLIVSTVEPQRPVLRSFRIHGGRVTEETVRIAPHPLFS